MQRKCRQGLQKPLSGQPACTSDYDIAILSYGSLLLSLRNDAARRHTILLLNSIGHPVRGWR